MPQKTLELTFNEYKVELAVYLGYNPESLSADQEAEILRFMDAGYTLFLSPPPLPGEPTGHEWSFLSPEASLSIQSGTSDYDAPADFGSFRGRPTFPQGSSYSPLEIVSDERIRAWRSSAGVNITGPPRCIAVRVKAGFTGVSGTTFQFLLYPEPSVTVVASYRYNVLVKALDADHPYPVGGAVHSRTILQAMLSEAERRKRPGERAEFDFFLVRLAASITADLALLPTDLGNYGDPSRKEVRFERSVTVSYNGVPT